jgi:hypothetical protein
MKKKDDKPRFGVWSIAPDGTVGWVKDLNKPLQPRLMFENRRDAEREAKKFQTAYRPWQFEARQIYG